MTDPAATATRRRRNYFVKHGSSRTPEYTAWRHIKTRCDSPRCRMYKCYGGRGIQMCGRLRNSFEAFLADVGPRPSAKHSIDRRDNEGHYSCGRCEMCVANGWPMNLRWATREVQDNNRRDNVVVEYAGERLTVMQWARRLGMGYSTLRARLRLWGVERAINEPLVSETGGARGERHGLSKTTEASVRAIRAAVAAGESQRAVAARFGISQSNVSLIVLRRAWSHVD